MKLTPHQLDEVLKRREIMKRNAHLFKFSAPGVSPPDHPVKSSSQPKRLRQSSKPLLNKLECEFQSHLTRYAGLVHIRAQAKTYKLANGVRFTPDFTAKSEYGNEVAYEVKGPHAFEDSMVKLKCAAALWPDVTWILVWKVNGCWHEQQILP